MTIAIDAIKEVAKNSLKWIYEHFFTNPCWEMDPREKAYLDASTDHFDLERRQRELLNRYQYKFYV